MHCKLLIRPLIESTMKTSISKSTGVIIDVGHVKLLKEANSSINIGLMANKIENEIIQE